jgi:ATP phosphoribosyltransferase
MLRIAVQKSGRLQEKSLSLLNECGLGIDSGKSELKALARNFPAELLFLRDDDIPQYVEDGVADLGILGENVILEKKKKLNIIERLGFAKCRLSIAVPKGIAYDNVHWLEGKRIATSYSRIVQDFLERNGVNAEIHEISGSVEIAPGIGLADAICDIVSTGGTLMSNGLIEVETVIKSEAVLVANTQLSDEKKALIDKLMFRIAAVNKAANNKYILLNAPNDKLKQIIGVLPGMKSPTVMPLAVEGWSSVHSVLAEEDFWEIIHQLKANGAQGILVIPIEKMIL